MWLDVDEARAAAADAEAALAAGDAQRAADQAQAALALFERPLLPELAGRWVDEQRAELDGLHSDALETLARAALRLGPGELPAADRAARALIQREPYRESGYAVLMELLAARGNAAEALRVYDQLRVLLRDELGATPAPHVTALNERLLRQGERPAAPATPAATAVPLPVVLAGREERPFVGREPELTVLRAGWERTPAGQGGVVVLTGDAGMGKTRLAARFAAEAHESGAIVLHGRIDEETVVPYQPFVEALRHYAAHARRPLRDGRRGARTARPRAGRARRRSPASARTAATGCSRPSPRCSTARPASARCCWWSRISNGRGARRCCCSATSSAACTARR